MHEETVRWFSYSNNLYNKCPIVVRSGFSNKILLTGKFLILILFLSPFFTSGQSPLLLNESTLYSISTDQQKIYKDSSRKLTLEEVLKQEFVLNKIDFGKSDWKKADYWLKIKVKNNSKVDRWLFEISEFSIQHVEFYDIQNGVAYKTGYAEKFGTRPYKHKNFIFPIEIPQNTEKIFYLKLSSNTTFGPTIKIHSYETFFSYSNKEYILLGLYYGLLILIACYNLFLYMRIKDKAHLFYVFYVLTIGLRTLQGDGLGFQYLWPEYPWLNQFILYSPELLLVSFSAYAIFFLEFRKRNPVYYRIIIWSLGGYFILFFSDKFISVPFLYFIYIVPFIVIYILATLVLRNNYKPARFFVWGYSILILSQLTFVLLILTSILNILFENEIIILFLVYGINIGFVIEAFIFSIALADKVKLYKDEKENAQQITIQQLKTNEELKNKVNKELEQKVYERTHELEQAKIQLQEQAETINRMNLQLDRENFSLKTNMEEINKERGFLKALSYEEFTQTFPNETACYRFIEELKWGEGFVCRKCGNTRHSKTTNVFSKKCSKCTYIDTIKANTIFHNVKFPIEKAFALIYLILSSEGEVSSYDLAKKLSLQQKTCLAFRQKLLDKIKREHIKKKDLIEKGWSILITEH